MISRQCVKKYQFFGTNEVIEKGTCVHIPVHAIQNDAKYYPNPKKFDPNRFLEDNEKSFIEMPYFPFGEGNFFLLNFFSMIMNNFFLSKGPRNCIAARLGKLQTQVGAAIMLSKYNFELSEKHSVDDELQFSPSCFLITPSSGINLKVSSR